MRLGIIDMGSNTMRLVVWEIYGRGYYRIIDELKESVRLGSQYYNPEIPQEKIEEAIHVLKGFKTFCTNLRVDKTIVLATEAVRSATNRESFLERVKKEAGFEPDVLSAEEESYLDYCGVSSSMNIKNSLMVDIGGSATALVWIRDNELVKSTTIPIGTLTLTEEYELEDIVSSQNHIAMEARLLEEFSKISWLKGSDFNTMILVGGSARTIGRMDRYQKRYPLSITHNYTLLDLDVIDLYNQMMTKTAYTRSKLRGLEKNRADLIIGALGIVKTLCRISGLQELRISGSGLREGKLFQYIHAHYDYYPDMLDASINAIMERHDLDAVHAGHVFCLADKMYKSVCNPNRLPEDTGKILKCAALLHDSGMSIRYYDHEDHSFYIILNSAIHGLNHKEILMAALAARFHRKNEADLPISAFSQLINKMDLNLAERLGLLIGIAEAFEKNLNQIVYDVECVVTEEKITIIPHARENIDTEIAAAAKMKEKFHQVFKRELELIPRIEG